jgi:hypothetical protein
MRALQVLKIPYAPLPDLLVHLKILHKLPLLLKIHHLHNLSSIILQSLLNIVLFHMFILQSLLTLPLLKIHQLNKLLSIVLLHMFILQSLLTLPLFFKIHQLNKLLSIVLLHMFIL